MQPVPGTNPPAPLQRALALLALVAAGEAIFFLPFLLARVFRPTVLEVFRLTNLELGTAYGAYGVLAMGAYLLGGPLADRFRTRSLLTVALLATAAGGLLLLAIPPLETLVALYATWGITTIALFWAPLIKATRVWGGELSQGAAFGLLDGGRGLFAAVTGSLMVTIFAMLLPDDVAAASLDDKTTALRAIIVMLLAMTAGSAALLWWVLPANDGGGHPLPARLNLRGLQHAARLPAVWLQACIILCAYVGFRAIDDFALYGADILGLDAVGSAALGTGALWLRPLAAVAAGFAADRLGSGPMTIACFGLLFVGGIVLASGGVVPGRYGLFVLGAVSVSLGVFALRGLYFAIMQPARVPLAVTGSAVGLVSLVGYLPDVFMGPLMGWLLDASPGALGHQRVFGVVTGFAVLGLVAAMAFQRITSSPAHGVRIGPSTPGE